jgi:uncharacterized membrane protein (DUF4010 family)
MMDLTSSFQQLGIALGLGLLVGLQRERAASRLAGMRTFPLVTVLGTLCSMLSQGFGGWILGAGFVALAAFAILGNLVELREGTADPGLTTEVALLLMFAVGAYLVVGVKEVAIAIGGGVAVLLQFKGSLHVVARKLGDADLTAIMRFALISLVILPALPNRAYGPYAVLNPREIWLMVVLIVGISLAGYIVYRFFGEQAGIVTGGILGGLISSTATTVSYARRTSTAPASSRAAAVVIMVASTIVFGRILLEIGLVAPSFVRTALPPIALLMVLQASLAAGMWLWGRNEATEMPIQENPTELKSALGFAALYAIVVFAVAAAKQHFGERGLYAVAALSGLTDMDAITLSTAQLVNSARLEADRAWRVILLASLSNLVFKSLIVAALGRRELLARIAPLFGVVLLAGGAILLLWPRPH